MMPFGRPDNIQLVYVCNFFQDGSSKAGTAVLKGVLMLAAYEFEFFEDEGWALAIPFGLEGGTQGRDMTEVALMVADWLRGELEHALTAGDELPAPTFGNAPEHGGVVEVVALEAPTQAGIALSTYVFDALLTPAEEGGYSAEVPALSGCFTCGNDFLEAVSMAIDAARTWVASALRHGETVPAYRREKAPAGSEHALIAFDADASWIAGTR